MSPVDAASRHQEHLHRPANKTMWNRANRANEKDLDRGCALLRRIYLPCTPVNKPRRLLGCRFGV